MGKGKGGKAKRRESADVAERHDFDAGGLLGHVSGTYAPLSVGEALALSVDVVAACVRILGDAIGGARLVELRGDLPTAPSRLVRRPAMSMTRREWLWRSTATLALYNTCYFRAVGVDALGDALSLVPLTPGRLVRLDGHWRLDGVETLDDDEVRVARRAYWPSLAGDAGTYMRLARQNLAAAWAAAEYRTDFWENGGAPTIVLSTEQELRKTADIDQPKEIRDAWVAARREDPGAPAVLGKGVSADTLGADIAAEGASSAGDRLGASIARGLGVPAHLVNVRSEAGSLTYTTTESNALDLIRFTLDGYAGPLSDVITEELPGDPVLGRSCLIDLSHLSRPTMLERFTAWQIATGGKAWMRPSEVRTAESLPPDGVLDLDPAGTAAPALETIA